MVLDWISDHTTFAGALLILALSLFSFSRKGKKEKKAIKKWDEAVKNKLDEPTTMHPAIDEALCAGCGSCVTACPEGQIIQLINHKAVLVTPTKCVGHGACEIACPFGAIDLVFGTKTRGMEIPRVNQDFETNVPGLYIAGELGGMGLIRNAIKQGALAAEHASSTIKAANNVAVTDTDVLIVGAGPAGFAAALKCAEKKVRYQCIEQNSFGGTIYNFPRQKIVTSHPLEFPIVGAKKFKQALTTKEEILALFDKIRKDNAIKIDDRVSFKNLTIDHSFFKIETSKGFVTSKKVLLCMGLRGSPRRLGLPNEDLPKVTYNLIDPEEYKQKHIAVVGGGNAALEAAQYLCKDHLKNKVLLVARGKPEEALSRANEHNQNLVYDLVKKNRLQIAFDAAVTAIEPDKLSIKEGEKVYDIENDFLFIFAGAEVPFKFLMSLGIKIDKAHGEVPKKKKS